MNLTVEKVAVEEMTGIWTSCTELAHAMAYPSFFCTGEWLKAVVESLYSANQAIFLVVKEKVSVRAVLPLLRKRNLLGGFDLHFLGSDFYPDPLGLISADTDRARSAAAIKEYLLTLHGWDRLVLDCVLEDEAADWEIPGTPVSVEPYALLPARFSDLLGNFKKKKRYNLRAMVGSFAEAGGEFVTPGNGSSHADFLDALFVLHRKRAEERELQSTFKGEDVEKLHRKLVAETEKVRFYGLRMNQQFVAVLYGFEFGNRFFYYQIAHDPSWGHLSPGSVLLYLVIENCCARGLYEFNFLQGDEVYKWGWTKESRVLYRCILSRQNWRSLMLHVFSQAKGCASMRRWLGRGN